MAGDATAVDVSRTLLEGKIRRQFLLERHPEYVAAMLSKRAGQCSRCGICCSLLVQCPAYVHGVGCSQYDSRPEVCRIFPIDQRDVDEVSMIGGRCSYSFAGAGDMALMGDIPSVVPDGSMINEAIIDRFTFVHLSVGSAMNLLGLPFWSVVVLSLVFEVFENLLQPKMTSIFPNTAERDSPMNSSVDTLAVVGGWWIAEAMKAR
jgi:hypothetical protein